MMVEEDHVTAAGEEHLRVCSGRHLSRWIGPPGLVQAASVRRCPTPGCFQAALWIGEEAQAAYRIGGASGALTVITEQRWR